MARQTPYPLPHAPRRPGDPTPPVSQRKIQAAHLRGQLSPGRRHRGTGGGRVVPGGFALTPDPSPAQVERPGLAGTADVHTRITFKEGGVGTFIHFFIEIMQAIRATAAQQGAPRACFPHRCGHGRGRGTALIPAPCSPSRGGNAPGAGSAGAGIFCAAATGDESGLRGSLRPQRALRGAARPGTGAAGVQRHGTGLRLASHFAPSSSPVAAAASSRRERSLGASGLSVPALAIPGLEPRGARCEPGVPLLGGPCDKHRTATTVFGPSALLGPSAAILAVRCVTGQDVECARCCRPGLAWMHRSTSPPLRVAAQGVLACLRAVVMSAERPCSWVAGHKEGRG